MQDYKDNNLKIGSNGFSGENNGKINQNDRRKVTIVNKYEYKEVPEEELQKRKEKQESKRYGLLSNVGEVKRCLAILTDHVSISKNDNVSRYTLIHVIDKNTNEYLSDHMQIDKEMVDEFISKKYREGKLCLVEIVGEVEKYGNNNDRVAINITKSKNSYIKRADPSFTTIKPQKYNNKITPEQRVRVDIRLQHKDDLELMYIINKLRQLLNYSTQPNNLPDDYVYNFVVNQYLVNSCHKDLYSGNLPYYRMNVNHYIDLIYILSYAFIIVDSITRSDIISIMRMISMTVCSFMGLENNKRYNDCEGIRRFANKIGLEFWQVKDAINYMVKDFKLDDIKIIPIDKLRKTSQKFLLDKNNLFKIMNY